MFKELIVVEGKNDASAVHKAFPQADVMITHGWGLTSAQIQALQTANQRRGVIILTDPDHAGEMIRRRLSALLPGCRHAFIPREKAIKNGKIGVEAASAEDLSQALALVRSQEPRSPVFNFQDLTVNGLSGSPDAEKRRKCLGAMLSIGYANSKTFLWRLNALGVTRAEFNQALLQMEAELNGCNEAKRD